MMNHRVYFQKTSWVTFKKRTKIKCPFFLFGIENFIKNVCFFHLKHSGVSGKNPLLLWLQPFFNLFPEYSI